VPLLSGAAKLGAIQFRIRGREHRQLVAPDIVYEWAALKTEYTMNDNQRELCNRQIKQINEGIDELMQRRMTSDTSESRLQAMEIEILTTTQRRVWEILLEYDKK
jgi:hypothetical protein